MLKSRQRILIVDDNLSIGYLMGRLFGAYMRIRGNYILILFVTFIYASNFGWGQDLLRTINLGENEEIMEIKSNQSYTSVFTYTSFKSPEEAYEVCLFDKNGNEVFKKTHFEQIPGSFFFDENQENLIIVMTGGPPNSGIIKSVNIITQKTNWTAHSNASRYVISPDGKKLLTAMPPIESKPQLQVIDLKTGKVEDINLSTNYYGAEWYDNDRIISCNRLAVETNDIKKRKPENEIEEISAELAKLAKLLKENRIEKTEYNEQVKKLIDKRRSLTANAPSREELLKEKKKVSRSELLKKRKARVSRFSIDRKFELVLYNRETQGVVKRIPMIVDNTDFKIPYQGYDINTITVDKSQNVFVSGLLNKKRYLIRYNKELQFIKSYEIEKYSKITRFMKVDHYIYRKINKLGEIELLDEKTGRFRKISDFEQFPKEIKGVSRKQNHYVISDNYELIDSTNTLLIKN